MKTKRILLVGRHYIIEPLGLIYLAGVAKKLGYEIGIHLVKDGDFSSLFEEIKSFQPNIVGSTIWTGYHVKTFPACDRVRKMGIPVIIGGPHATYFTAECAKHADYVVKGEGFRTFRKILSGELSPGIHFDSERVAEGFPTPERYALYRAYPELKGSPIKSIMASVGCPFTCSYCYAPVYNEMYDGFKLKVRPIDELIREGKEIRDQWPARMIYFQDDIFGFNMKWLTEFAERWPREVGIPWHCQIRLELTHDEKRLDLFKKGGCTGITLAIESGNDFLRTFVLCRHMNDELIMEGCKKITDRGLTLRTEQILAVPFSDIGTDLETLHLNCRLNPEMAWTSILAPYKGTSMGAITSQFGFYSGNNDDIKESFFDRSVLKHTVNGRALLEGVTRKHQVKSDNPLLRMYAKHHDDLTASVFLRPPEAESCKEPTGEGDLIETIRFCNEKENTRYADQTVMLQRIFNWLSKVPEGHVLGKTIVSQESSEWTWEKIGKLTRQHLVNLGYSKEVLKREEILRDRMGVPKLPKVIAQNPDYFTFFPGGDLLASLVVADSLFENGTRAESFDKLGVKARRHLFMKSLYEIEPAEKPIASM